MCLVDIPASVKSIVQGWFNRILMNVYLEKTREQQVSCYGTHRT